MANNKNFDIKLISGISPSGDFPLVEAEAVAFYEPVLGADGKPTEEIQEIRLTDKIKQVGISEQDKTTLINTAIEKTIGSDSFKALEQNLLSHGETIGTIQSDIDALELQLAAQKGDNENLIVHYDKVAQKLYLYEKNEKGTIDFETDKGIIKVNQLSETSIQGGSSTGTGATFSLSLSVAEGTKDYFSALEGRQVLLPYEIRLVEKKTDTVTGESSFNPITNETVTYSIYHNDVFQRSFSEKTVKNGNIDVTDLLTLGVNNFKIVASVIEYIDTKNENGEDITVAIPARATARWTINVVSLKLELPKVSNSNTNEIGWDATPKLGTASLTYKVVGALPKKVYFILDGDEDNPHIETINATEFSSTYTVPKQTHGIHTLEIYCEGVLNAGTEDEETVSTDRTKYIIMFVENGNNRPLIRVKASDTAEQYSNTIVYFNVYDPLDETANLVEIYEDNVLRTTYPNIDSTEQIWTYNPQEPGLKRIKIKYLQYEEYVDINVNKFPYEVSPAKENLMVDFVPRGRSNQDSDYNVFKNNAFTVDDDGSEVEIPMNWTFSENFDWINGGWQKDAAGDEYFCIKAGTSVNFDYNLFNKEDTVAKKDTYGNYSIAGTGKEFKLIFKTANVARADATWLSCIAPAENGQLTGLEMQAHNAYVKSNFDTLEIPYSEEDIIEFDMNIVPITKFTATYEPELTSKVIPMILTYEDGTPVQPKVITNPATSFKQTNAVPISIGSNYCDVHIYRLKIYERYLSESEILNNFIADARNGEEMSKRFRRNQIYMTGQSNFGGTEQDLMTLAEACPDLRVYLLSAPYFTNHKDDKVKNTTIKQWYYKNGKDSINDIWVATGATHRGQGTSSNEYGYSGRNLDFDMKKAEITLGDNKTKVSKISLTPTSVPTNYLNYKTNIASSEHANNALLQKRFDRYLPYETLASQLGAAKGQDVKNSMEFYNCVVFIQETDTDLSKHREFNDTKIHFYGIGNIGDSKKTDSSRLNDKNDTKEFCVEIMDWNRHLSTFPANTMMNAMGYTTDEATQEKIYTWAKDENLDILYELIDGQYQLTKDTTVNLNKIYYVDILEHDDFSEDYTYGFRYITEYEVEDASKLEEGETIEGNKQRNEEVQAAARQVWKDFYKFVTRDLTTNGKEDPAKVAAWKSEFADWFILDSALYYYLFTLRYTMVDNRAKNSFWHYGKCPDGKYRFEFWDYDNDTALGIDNAGKLEIPFGVEDNDTDAAGAPYFRANNSTFFTRVAKYFTTELNTMWTTVEQNTAKGNAFDSTNFINEFDTWQEQFPEELWRLDYERKYKRTYVGGEGADWDNALPKIVDGKKVVEKRYLTEMMNGRKKYQRRQFERNQDAYMSSKFFGNKNYSNSITLRGSGAFADKAIPADFTLRVIPFNNMYLNLHDGTNYFYHNRVFAGQQYNINLLDSIAKLDLMYIRGASNLQELGDLSLMYLQTATLGAGSKLKTVILGNPATGYSNDSLQTLEVGASNQMLEELDIRNLSNLTSTDLPVTSIPSLKRVYAQGSNILTARFANNGLLEEAYLPATLTQLELRNLYFLKTIELEGYSNLIDLTIENCNISANKQIEILQTSTNLKNLRITNVDWTFDNAEILLNRLAKLNNSVITGKVYLEHVRRTELDLFAEKWPELTVSYPPNGIIPQQKVTFRNRTGEFLGEFYVDRGFSCPDPIIAGLFSVPTLESTAQYTYDFIGWSKEIEVDPEYVLDLSFQLISEDTIYYAQYAKELRKYTVSWYESQNSDPIYTVSASYGDEVSYPEIPIKSPYENIIFYLFKEWDKSTGYITGDTHVYAIWEEADGPEVYNRVNKGIVKVEDLNPTEIYALAQYSATSFKTGDYIQVQLGYMPTYSTDSTKERVLAEGLVLTGKNYQVFEDIELFKEDKDFVIALDFTPAFAESGIQTYLSCYQGGTPRGMRIYNDNNKSVLRVEPQAPIKYINPSEHQTSASTQYREICVLRHKKGESGVILYRNDRYSMNPVESVLMPDPQNGNYTGWYPGKHPLVLGAEYNGGSITNIAKGTIHYAKIWFEDIGEEECKKICSWTYDRMNFDYVGPNRYYYAGTLGTCKASFISQKLLDEARYIYPNSSVAKPGGWKETELKEWMNTKLFGGMSVLWKQILSRVTIGSIQNTESGDVNNEIRTTPTYSDNYLYLPSVKEVITNPPVENVFSKELSESNLTTYPVFGDTSEGDKRIKELNGVPSVWWLRSPYYRNDAYQATLTYWNAVGPDGSVPNTTTISIKHDYSTAQYTLTVGYKYGICPCFSI